MSKQISLIVALSRNRVIGQNGKIPWHIPEDLRRFREITTGHSIIMGRKTFESILLRNGRPLPQRQNIVMTRDKSFKAPGSVSCGSFAEAIEISGSNHIHIIGGSEIYAEALKLRLPQKMHLTVVERDYEGDAFFPKYDESEWWDSFGKSFAADKNSNQPGGWFRTLVRRVS